MFALTIIMRLPEKPLHGIILAGGRSLRFGSDKALALFKDKPLIEHAIGLVESVGIDVAVITSRERDYSFLKRPIYFDRDPFLGPLSGLDRAFELYPSARLLVLSCDMPFLRKKDLVRLLDEDNGLSDVVLYRLNPDRFQPFPGIYAASLKCRINLRDQGSNSMQAFLKKIDRITEIGIVDSHLNFSNVNKVENLSETEYDPNHCDTLFL